MSAFYQTLVEAVLSHAEKSPNRPAVGFQSEVLTYRELAGYMKSAAEILRKEYGINKGDRVMLSAVSRPDYVVCFLAIQYRGGYRCLLIRRRWRRIFFPYTVLQSQNCL